jgi:hypothetical protein
MHIYEYLFAAILIVIIVIASSTMVETLSEPARSTSEKEQLKVAAQKIITQILLDPGDPSDWGSNIAINENNLKAFGLAKSSNTTREAYVLDTDKVLRLDNTNPLYIPPSKILNLLNLGYEYGFALDIHPALNVTITNLSLDEYKVNVTSEYGETPIIGANVTAKLYFFNNITQKIDNIPIPISPTDIDGKYIFDFGDTQTQKKVLFVVVDYYGIHVVKTYIPSTSSVVEAYLIGHNIFLDSTYTIFGNVTQVLVTKENGEYTIKNVTTPVNKIETGKYSMTYVEPSATKILAMSESNTLIFASRDATLIYSSIEGVSLSFPFAYSIERSLIIGGSVYVVRLYLWRMSW